MPGKPHNDPRRSTPRHAPEGIANECGEVLDLSATGMRLRCKGRSLQPGEIVAFALTCSDGTIRMRGRVAWRRRTGLFTHEIGVRFLDLTKSRRRALGSLAEFGFIQGGASNRNGNAQRTRSKRDVLRATFETLDYYRMLGVRPDASTEDIKKAYRHGAIRLHPDRNPGDDAAAQFAALTIAYEVLIDPEQRALYDLGHAA